jgi:hypothetical protein
MTTIRHVSKTLLGTLAILGASTCSSMNSPVTQTNTGGSGDSGGAGAAGSDAGGGLKAFSAPADPGPGGILFAASGEALALNGYDFPPASANAAAFVDGWQVRFTRLLVTIDKIVLSSNPDAQGDNQSLTGAVFAEVDGPWAIDLHHSDPSYLPGKGGAGEEAVPFAALSRQNKNGNQPFDTTGGTRYAFGFDTVDATYDAYNVNLDAPGQSDYDEMVQNQCVVFYRGIATFRGDKTDSTCYPADRQSWPDVVNFTLCFKSPTSYVNCQNPDNGSAPAFPNEEYERGIAFLTNSSVIGQVTIHTDHPFWDSVLHDSPAHFDQYAARVVGQDTGTPTVTLEMIKGVDYTDYTDVLGKVLNWRYCTNPPTDVHPQLTGVMRFDPQSVPHATNNDPSTGLRDYYDFATYDQSTQGHLNSDGLCYIKRHYPSPN